MTLAYSSHSPLRTTLALTCHSDRGCTVHSEAELRQFLEARKPDNDPLLVIGEGSNMVLPDTFHGTAMYNRILGRELLREDQDHVWLRFGAGESWHQLVQYCLQQHWYGLENLALIPGCIGAAPIQNIGAYGVELKDVFVELEAYQISTAAKRTFSLDECRFAYRESCFKQHHQGRYVISAVTLRLDKHFRPQLDYPALANRFREEPNPTAEAVFDAVCAIRRSKLPDPKHLPNAGSFFKNPVVSHDHWQQLQQAYPDLVGYPQRNGVKLAAGWLIERAGWKGRQLGAVGMHQDQALVLVNYGQATQDDVLALVAAVKQDISEQFEVDLEVEPRIYSGDGQVLKA